MKNKEENKLDYLETPRTLMVEKLIMNELLNAEEFDVLLQTTQEEFRRTFGFTNKTDFER